MFFMNLFPSLEKESFKNNSKNNSISNFLKDIQNYFTSFQVISQLQKLSPHNLYTLDRFER